ncbi:MAG: ribose-phosphate pyrophosphokinase [Chloroflexia bacterium]|nr:ribose-phosphate pyrophosphokinase [Chloroflexia bacterium]
MTTLRLFSGNANLPLAQEVASILGIPLGKLRITHLPDSETHVEILECVRKQDVFLMQTCSDPVNEHSMSLFLLVDAFRRASARSITVVAPYFPYTRQERMARGREAISTRVVATILESLGVDRVIYVDVHSPAIQGFFGIPVDPLTAVPILAKHFGHERFAQAAIVAPDTGRAKMAGRYAELLQLPLVVMQKRREDRQIRVTHISGDIRGHIPIIIDDVIAGGSVLDEIPALLEAGARPEVYLSITHPVLVGRSLEKLCQPFIKELVVSNTIHVPPEKQVKVLRVISIAPLLAAVIQHIYEGHTISPLLQLV